MSRNPIEEKGGLNLQGFANNAPTRFIDKLGKEAHDGSTPEDDPNLPIPIPDGRQIIIPLKEDRCKMPCGYFCPRAITNCQDNIVWQDLIPTGCASFKLLVGGDICKTMDDMIKKAVRNNECFHFDCPKKKPNCRNQATFTGTYPVTVPINPAITLKILRVIPACTVSGSVTATISGHGKIGGCYE